MTARRTRKSSGLRSVVVFLLLALAAWWLIRHGALSYSPWGHRFSVPVRRGHR